MRVTESYGKGGVKLEKQGSGGTKGAMHPQASLVVLEVTCFPAVLLEVAWDWLYGKSRYEHHQLFPLQSSPADSKDDIISGRCSPRNKSWGGKWPALVRFIQSVNIRVESHSHYVQLVDITKVTLAL